MLFTRMEIWEPQRQEGLPWGNARPIFDFVTTGQVVKPGPSFFHRKLAKELLAYEQPKYTFNHYDEAGPGDSEHSYDYL